MTSEGGDTGWVALGQDYVKQLKESREEGRQED